jgi:hypothetical protein
MESYSFLEHTKYHGLKSEFYHLFKILNESLNGRDHSEDSSMGGRIILKFILRKWVGRLWIGYMWLTIGARVAGSCEHGNEPSGSIKDVEFLVTGRLSASEEGLCSIKIVHCVLELLKYEGRANRNPYLFWPSTLV